MAKEKKVYFIIIGVFAFIAYILLAAQPIPKETILTGSWLRPLDTDFIEEPPERGSYLIPWTLGNRFGYAENTGRLALNKIREKTVSLSAAYWAEYEPAPREIAVHQSGGTEDSPDLILENPAGYPVFMDGRIFIISRDQSTLEEIGGEGKTLWTYSFESPVTCIDAAGGYVLAGTVDGTFDLLDSGGSPLFPSYAPGVSRIPVILGCRISSDGSRLAVVSGIDKQRFLFFERYGENDYRVTYHEFLKGEGFRREVQMAFIDGDSRVVFEQETGLGIYDVKSRSTIIIPLSQRLETLDEDGGDGLFFFITGSKNIKRLVGIKLPGRVLINIPFKSENAFLRRWGNELFIGGGRTLAAFKLDKR